MNIQSKKYCRSLHSHLSLWTTSDDRFMPKWYVKAFSEMNKLIITEKLDWQNSCFNKEGVFARSHTSKSMNPWDKPLWEKWELIKNDLHDIEIFWENMYGVHSIEYWKLESYFYVFAIRKWDTWLSWEDTKWYASLFDFPIVPEYKVSFELSNFVNLNNDENIALEKWLTKDIWTSWLESVDTEGKLWWVDCITKKPCSEWFVIRNADSFRTNQWTIKTNSNEFNNLFKLVREAHVKTEIHWSKTWKPAKLVDYEKHKWYGYEYLNNR